MTGYNDELALEDKERKVYLELYHFPRTFISVKPQSISLVIEDSKNPSINIKMEEFETQEGIKIDEIRLEGAKFTTSEYQSLIRKTVKDKKELKFNFRSNNNTYFLKNFEKSIFVIPENSLQQETIVSRNTNNSNSFFSSKILFFVLLGAFLILVLFSIFRLIKIRRISKK
jgi:hypothetical protein